MSNKKNKFGNQKNNTIYYGDYGLPFRGMINSFTNGNPRGTHSLPFMSSNFMINNHSNCRNSLTSVPINYHSFGYNWYPHMSIDNYYSTYSGGYSYPNAGLGPYSAKGLGNYPAKMFAESNRLYFNNSNLKNKYGKSNNVKKNKFKNKLQK